MNMFTSTPSTITVSVTGPLVLCCSASKGVELEAVLCVCLLHCSITVVNAVLLVMCDAAPCRCGTWVLQVAVMRAPVPGSCATTTCTRVCAAWRWTGRLSPWLQHWAQSQVRGAGGQQLVHARAFPGHIGCLFVGHDQLSRQPARSAHGMGCCCCSMVPCSACKLGLHGLRV